MPLVHRHKSGDGVASARHPDAAGGSISTPAHTLATNRTRKAPLARLVAGQPDRKALRYFTPFTMTLFSWLQCSMTAQEIRSASDPGLQAAKHVPSPATGSLRYSFASCFTSAYVHTWKSHIYTHRMNTIYNAFLNTTPTACLARGRTYAMCSRGRPYFVRLLAAPHWRSRRR